MGATHRRMSYSADGRAVGRRRHRRHLTPRSGALGLIAAALLAVLVVAVLPYVRRAIQHFTLPLSYAAIIRQQAVEKHLDPALIAAVIYAETRFHARTSPTGAKGLMQIEPSTAEFLARRSGGTRFTVTDLSTPQVNISYGSYYLRYLLNEYAGSTTLALAAYNAGDTNVNRWTAQARARHESPTTAAIPVAVRAYVSEVLSKQRAYRSSYAVQLGYR